MVDPNSSGRLPSAPYFQTHHQHKQVHYLSYSDNIFLWMEHHRGRMDVTVVIQLSIGTTTSLAMTTRTCKSFLCHNKRIMFSSMLTNEISNGSCIWATAFFCLILCLILITSCLRYFTPLAFFLLFFLKKKVYDEHRSR